MNTLNSFQRYKLKISSLLEDIIVKDIMHKVRHEVNMDQDSGLVYSPHVLGEMQFFNLVFFLQFSDIFSVTHPH